MITKTKTKKKTRRPPEMWSCGSMAYEKEGFAGEKACHKDVEERDG